MANLSLQTERLKSRDMELGELYETRLSCLDYFSGKVCWTRLVFRFTSEAWEHRKQISQDLLAALEMTQLEGEMESEVQKPVVNREHGWVHHTRDFPLRHNLSSLFSPLTSHLSIYLTYLHLSSVAFRERIYPSKKK